MLKVFAILATAQVRQFHIATKRSKVYLDPPLDGVHMFGSEANILVYSISFIILHRAFEQNLKNSL